MSEAKQEFDNRPMSGVVIRDGTGSQPTEVAALSGAATVEETLESMGRILDCLQYALSPSDHADGYIAGYAAALRYAKFRHQKTQANTTIVEPNCRPG